MWSLFKRNITKTAWTCLCNLAGTEWELPEDDVLESKHVGAINKEQYNKLSSRALNRSLKLKIYETLTFWRWNYFFLNFSTPVYKMWIIQEPNTLELWNKLHFEEQKVYTMFKIFGTYICWINIWNATLEVSGAVRQL